MVTLMIRRSCCARFRRKRLIRQRPWPTWVSLALVAGLVSSPPILAEPTGNASPRLPVPKTDDFELTGDGSNPAWQKTPWTALNVRGQAQHAYNARFKMLYSATGVYVLFDGSDARLTATFTDDFENLWTEDVYECFFWTDTEHPVYFEYEISPLGQELPILIPNLGGRFLGWRPWHYDGPRKTRKQVAARGGATKSLGDVTGWSAEVFIPFALLEPLGNVPPKSGTEWRANFYRVDHDDDRSTGWDWSRVGPSFHDFTNFGTLVFE